MTLWVNLIESIIETKETNKQVIKEKQSKRFSSCS